MKTSELIEYFGTQEKTADAMNVTQATVSYWLDRVYPPGVRQIQAERLTHGKLKAEADALDPPIPASRKRTRTARAAA